MDFKLGHYLDFAEWDCDADQGKVFDANGNSVGTWGVR